MIYHHILRAFSVYLLLILIPFSFAFGQETLIADKSEDPLPSIFKESSDTKTNQLDKDLDDDSDSVKSHQPVTRKKKATKKQSALKSGNFAMILAPFTKVQSGPSSKHNVITYLFEGDVVYITDQSKSESINGKAYRWYFIQVQPNIYGWIYGKYLKKSKQYSAEFIDWKTNPFYQDLLANEDQWLLLEDREQLNHPNDNLVIEANEVILRSLSGTILRFPFKIVDSQIEWQTDSFLQSSSVDSSKIQIDYSEKPGWSFVMTNRLIDSINVFQGNPAHDTLGSTKYRGALPKNYQNYALLVKSDFVKSLPIRKQKIYLAILEALRNQLVQEGRKYGIYFHLDSKNPYDKVIVQLDDIKSDRVILNLLKRDPSELDESSLYKDRQKISLKKQSTFDFNPIDYVDLALFFHKQEIANNPDTAIFVLNTSQQVISSILDNSKIAYTKSPLEIDANGHIWND